MNHRTGDPLYCRLNVMSVSEGYVFGLESECSSFYYIEKVISPQTSNDSIYVQACALRLLSILIDLIHW
jgi:hypothetical protein